MHDHGRIIHELRGMGTTGHLFRVIPLAIFTTLCSLWPYIGSPFVPVAIATLIALEPFYSNACNLWRGQLTAMAVLPIELQEMFRHRNIAVVALTWGCAMFFGVLAVYVQPEPTGMEEIAGFSLYLASVQFPLLIAGNNLSWQQIRPLSRWKLDDASAATLMLGIGTIVSLPYIILRGLPAGPYILMVYVAVMGSIWWHFALPRTARIIHEQLADLWQQTHTI